MIQWGDVGTWFIGVATSASVLFAAGQFRRSLRSERSLQLRGVAVSWQAIYVPRHAEHDGIAQWTYEFIAHNPGPLPIKDVEIDVNFPMVVTRRHGDGSDGTPTQLFHMRKTVMAGHQVQRWERHFRLPYDQRRQLSKIDATITFRDLEDKRHQNHWSPVTSSDQPNAQAD